MYSLSTTGKISDGLRTVTENARLNNTKYRNYSRLPTYKYGLHSVTWVYAHKFLYPYLYSIIFLSN